MSAPKPPPKHTIESLLAAAGLAGITRGERNRMALQVTREIATQKYATAFLQCLDYVKAYQNALRPHAKLNGRETRSAAWVWFCNPRVQRHIAQPVDRGLREAKIDTVELIKRIQEQADSSLFDYAIIDDQGLLTGWQFDIATMTPAMKRNVREIQLGCQVVKNEHGQMELRTYTKSIKLVDSQRAIEMAIGLMGLLARVKEGSNSGTLPAELTAKLVKARELRESMNLRLPAPRVRTIIEGEKQRS